MLLTQASVNDKLFGGLSAKKAEVLAAILPKLVIAGDQALTVLRLTIGDSKAGQSARKRAAS